MRAGKLDRRLTILKQIDTGQTDSHGQPVFEFTALRTVWAAKVHRREDEEHAASQTYARRVVTFRIRHADDVTELDRLECEGLTYTIRGIREIGRKIGLEIAAEWQS